MGLVLDLLSSDLLAVQPMFDVHTHYKRDQAEITSP